MVKLRRYFKSFIHSQTIKTIIIGDVFDLFFYEILILFNFIS